MRLSICVPTFNRANWLRVSLPLWAEQAVRFPGECEIVVSDNASPDDTQSVISEVSQRFEGAINSYRNSENIGGNPNFYKCVNELAQGQWVWVVGDDDLPLPGVIERVLKVLREHSDVSLLFAPYAVLTIEAPPPYGTRAETLLPNARSIFDSHEARRVSSVRELVPMDWGCFTAIYASILRRDDAVEAYRPSLRDAAFTTVESVSSHALYIARHLLHRPAYYLGETCLVVSTNCSWEQYSPIQHVEHLPHIHDVFERCGAGRAVMDRHRATAMRITHSYIAWFIVYNEAPLRDKFSLRRYIWRHRRVPLLLPILVRVFVLVLYLKTPRVITRLPLLLYRTLKARLA